MLEFAAREAFFDFSESTLARVAEKELGIELEGDLGEKLFALVQTVLKVDDAEAAMIVDKRVVRIEDKQNSFDELVQSDEAMEQVDDADQGELKKFIATAQTQARQLSSLRQIVSKAVAKLADKPKKRRKKCGATLPKNDAEYTVDNMLPFFPPTLQIRLRKDLFNGRWHAFWRRNTGDDWHSLSRSWGSRSHEECLRALLRASWKSCVDAGQMCPIEGLFPAAPAA